MSKNNVFIKYIAMETKDEYEYKNLRICKHNLQIESCRKCLFEVLCHYEDMKEKLEKTDSLVNKRKKSE